MSARIIGPWVRMGPVATAAGTVIEHGAVVRVVNGLVVAVVNAAVAGLAVAMTANPDADYETRDGTGRQAVDLCKLGEDLEVELPFSGRAIAAADIGTTFNILSANGGTVNLSLTAAPAFKITYLSRNTRMGDTTGYVVGVFLDSVTF